MISRSRSAVRKPAFILAATCAALVGAAPLTLHAQTLTWDISPGAVGAGDDVVTGGSGVWDSALGNWTADAGATNVAWDDLSAAIFGGTAGIVTIDDVATGVSTTGITFAASGYTIAAASDTDTLTLTGPSMISVGSSASDTATISAIIAGVDGLAKSGPGTLVLAGANLYSGTTNIAGGAISISAVSGLGTSTTAIRLNGGTLRTTADFTLNRGFALTGAANSLDVATGTNLTLGTSMVPSVSGAGTAITKTGAGTLTLTTATDTTFTNGQFIIEQGTVNFSSANQLGAASTGLTLAGGTANHTGVTATTGRVLTLNPVAGNVLSISNAGTALTFSAATTGTGGMTKEGAGSAIFSNAANAFSGGFTINAGTLQFNSAGALNGNAVILSGGNLRIQSDTAQTSLSTVDVTAPSTITTARNAAGAGVAHALSSLTMGTQALTVTTAVANSGTQRLDITGATTLTANPIFNVVSAGGATAELRLAGTIAIDPGATLTKQGSGVLNFGTPLALATGAVVIEGGSIAMSGTSNTHVAGTTTITGGGLSMNSSHTWETGSFTASGGGTSPMGGNSAATVTTLRIGAGGLALNGHTISLNSVADSGGSLGSRITFTEPTAKITSSASSAITVANGYGTRELDLNGTRTFEITAGTLTVGARIANGGIVKTGAGTLQVNGNSHALTGGVVINGGTVSWNNTNATATVDGGFTVNAGGTIQLTASPGSGTESDATYTNTLGLATNNFTINGGTIFVNYGVNDRTILNREFTIGAGGATFNVAGGYTNFVESTTTQLRLVNTNGYLIGSGPATKSGGGRLTLRNSNPSFSGAWTIENGTLETSGAGLGDGSAGNSVTVNGGNLSLTGNLSQNTTLNGGAIAQQGATRTLSGTVEVASGSFFFLNEFYRDNGASAGLTLSNVLSGSGSLGIAVNRAGYDANSGTVLLQNTGNTYSGTITVGKNLRLENNAAAGVGKTLGTASIELASGNLNLRDNGAGSNGALAYGNDVSVIAATGLFANGDLATLTNTIDANRASGTNTGNMFQLGTLGIGAQQLNVTGGNGYSLVFNGLTTLTGDATFNATTANLSLLGGVAGPGFGFTKSGAGTLTIGGASTADGLVAINAGTVIFNSEASIGGTGATVTANAGTTVGAGSAISQSFVDRIADNSAGIIALAANSANSLNLSAFADARLSAIGSQDFSGTLLAGASGYRLGGGAAGHVLTISGANALTGARAVEIGTGGTGAGTVAITGLNNFTGEITVNGGETLLAGSNGSLGDGANAITLDAGTLQLADGGDFTGFGARQLTVGAGSGTLNTGTNNVAINTGIAGGGNFTKTGAGTLTFSAINAFTGETIIGGGAIAFADPSVFGATSRVRLSGGTLSYTGASTSLGKEIALSNVAGNTIAVAAGTTLEHTANITGGTANTTVLTVAGPGKLYLNPSANNAFAGNILVTGGVLATAGPGATNPSKAFGTPARTVTLSGGTFRVESGAFNPNGSTVAFVMGAAGGTIDVASGGQLTLDDGTGNTGTGAGAQLQGSGNLTKIGNGTLQLGYAGQTANGFKDFAGAIFVNEGTLLVGQTNALGTAGVGTTVAAGATMDLRSNQGGTHAIVLDELITISGNGVGGIGALVNNGSTAVATLNGALTLAGNAGIGGAGSGGLAINGAIGDGGSGYGITKLGTNTVTIGSGAADAAANTYRGVTTVSAGVLLLNKQANLTGGGGAIAGDNNTATTDVVIAGGTLRLLESEQIANSATVSLGAGTFDLNGKTETIHDLSLNGGFLVRGTGGSLVVTNPNSDFNVDLVVYDGDALGANAINRNVHYVGTTTAATISSLTLAGPALGHTISVANGTAADDLTISGVVDGFGKDLIKTGAGTLVLAGANTFGGDGNLVVVSGGSLAYTAETGLGDPSNGIIVNSGGLLQPRGLTTLTVFPQIGTGGGGFDIPAAQTTTIATPLGNVAGQSGALIKGGAGTLVLTAANTFDGGITAMGGIVRALGGTAASNPIGAGPITINGGNFELRNDASTAYANDLVVAGSGLFNFQRASGTSPGVALGIGDLIGVNPAATLTLVGSHSSTLTVGDINLAGGLQYGSATGYANPGISTVIVAAGSSVSIGSGSANNFRLGLKQVAGDSSQINTTFDASAAASFIANVGRFDVTIETASGTTNPTSTLRLPASAAITAATSIIVADTNNQGGSGTLSVGNGATTFTTPVLTVGSSKGTGTLNFLSPLSTTTLTIGNGAGRTALNVGANDVNTGIQTNSAFNASSAALIGNFSTGIIGSKAGTSSAADTGAGGSTATFTIGGNAANNVSFVVGTGTAVTIGRGMVNASIAATTRSLGTGTLNFGGGNLAITTGDATAAAVRLGVFTNGAAAGNSTANMNVTSSGTLNITGGSVSITTGGGPAIEMTPTNTFVTGAPYKQNATVAISGGSVSLGGAIAVGVAQGSTTSTSTLTLSGGTLDLNGKDIGAVTNLNFTGGTLREVGTLARGLTQTGEDSQLLVTGNHTTIQGAYSVTDGSVHIDAGSTLAATGDVSVASGTAVIHGELSGSLTATGDTVVRGIGAITGALNLTGADAITRAILDPGASPGTLDIGGALSFGEHTTLALQLGGGTPGDGTGFYSQVNVTSAGSAVSIASTAQLSLSLAGGFFPSQSDVFYILNRAGADAFTSLFAGTTEGGIVSLGGDVTGQITYAANWDGSQIGSSLTGGNDVAIFNVVPEPTSTATLLAGLASLLGLRRSRRRDRA